MWRAVLVELGQVLTPENFNAWLSTTRALDQDGEVLRVAVPAAFNKTWLDPKLAGRVACVLHKIDDDAPDAGRVGRVEYVVGAPQQSSQHAYSGHAGWLPRRTRELCCGAPVRRHDGRLILDDDAMVRLW